jgi:hypothetical protein
MMLSNPREAATVGTMAKKKVRGFVHNRGIVVGLLASGLLTGTGVWAADTAPAAQQTLAQQTPAPQTPPQQTPVAPVKSPASKPAAAAAQSAKSKTSQSSTLAKGKAHPTRYAPDRFAGRAGKFYELTWGVDSLNVKLVESGELVRFSYRVLDPVKARSLNDKQSEASLIDPKAGVSLVVPTMEKVGQLRQTASPEAGRSYWMTFSNKGGHVVRGDRVDVVIGTFKGSFLTVD